MLAMFTAKSMVEKSTDEQIDRAIQNMLDMLAPLPNFSCLQRIDAKKRLQEKLKACCTDFASEPVEPVEDRALFDNLIKGKYDSDIFEVPCLTEELKIVIAKHDLEFVETLFYKCKSIDTLKFWLDSGFVKLPQRPIAIAIAMHNNIFALRYIQEKGLFNNLDETDKREVLERAARFPGEGLEFLQQSLGVRREVYKLQVGHQ